MQDKVTQALQAIDTETMLAEAVLAAFLFVSE